MSPASAGSPRAAARNGARADSVRLWIGYPDRWINYNGLLLRDNQPTANLLAARSFLMDRSIASIGKPLDRDQWVDADPADTDGSYYNAENAFVLTAGELAGPFFDPRAEPAFNFGKIGQVIGHELTHSLYSRVRLATETGARADHWSPDEINAFTRLAVPMVEQYNGYFVNDSVHVNGRRTLSENMADVGGIALAFEAFQRASAGKPREIIDGFTPEQRFFVAYAQSINVALWRPEDMAHQADMDNYAHSAPQWRINGALSNFAPFATAFRCKEGDPMVRSAVTRWSVW